MNRPGTALAWDSKARRRVVQVAKSSIALVSVKRAMQLSQAKPLGLTQSRPLVSNGGRSCPRLPQCTPFRAAGFLAPQRASFILQAAKVEEAPAALPKAAPKGAKEESAAPAKASTAPALTPQDLDRVILMQGVLLSFCFTCAGADVKEISPSYLVLPCAVVSTSTLPTPVVL